ncbi:MAG: G5 domain-containing protein [Armatimonadetes bacterium]|nr:G5 domain-containing protein [Armatimonadota bacterium]
MPGSIRAAQLWAAIAVFGMLTCSGLYLSPVTARSEDAASNAPAAAPENSQEPPKAAAPAFSDETRIVTETETVSHGMKLLTSPKLRQGLSIVKQEGRKGIRKHVYRVVFRDGKEVSRTRTRTQWAVRPADRIIMVGAQKNLPSRGFFSGRKVLDMIATGYDPGPKSCGPRATGRTALGLRAGYGVVAVDPRYIPLGTRLYIEGYGYAVAADVGGKIKGNRIDLGHDTYRKAFGVGVRKVKVHILD